MAGVEEECFIAGGLTAMMPHFPCEPGFPLLQYELHLNYKVQSAKNDYKLGLHLRRQWKEVMLYPIHSQIHNLYSKGWCGYIIVFIYHLYYYVSTLEGVYINLSNLSRKS